MRYLLLVSCALSFVVDGLAQSADVVELSHPEKGRTVSLALGEKLSLRMNDGTRYRGVLSFAGQDSLAIDEQRLAYTDINFIGHRAAWTVVSGVVMTLTGIGIIAYGAAQLLQEDGQGEVVSGSIVLIGAGIGSLGPSLIRDGRRFYLDSDWKVQNRYR